MEQPLGEGLLSFFVEEPVSLKTEKTFKLLMAVNTFRGSMFSV